QAARTQDALNSVANSSQQAQAEQQMTNLLRTMEGLKVSDGPLSQATTALSRTLQGRVSWGSGGRVNDARTGFRTPPVVYVQGVQQVAQALQAKIQEMILSDALLDRDGAVPPQYKALVEDYYKALSEDLR